MKIRLVAVGLKKIAVIKAVRSFTGLNLRQSKALVDSAPVDLPVPPLGTITAEVANYTVREFRMAGATIQASHSEATALDKITAASYISTASVALGEGNVKDTRNSLRAALRLLGDFVSPEVIL